MALVDEMRTRSIRTLAWLGDAHFELEVRRRLAARGDYPTDRLDAMKAGVVRADAQAELLASIEADLEPPERDVAARARNAALPASARGKRNTRAYREATAFEALVAWWKLGPPPDRARFDAIVGPRLDTAIDAAIARDAARPRRG